MNRKLMTLRHGGQRPPVIWVGACHRHPDLFLSRRQRTSDAVYLRYFESELSK